MAVLSKTKSTLEGLVRDSSLKWLFGKRSFFDEEIEEIEKFPSAQRNWLSELSPFANVVVRRCTKILAVSASELQESFNTEAIDSLKITSNYARNLLEYCCFRALALCTRNTGYLGDKKFRRLTFDMMIAWEAPASSSQPLLDIDEEASVGVEAFSRIAPAVPIISNVIVSENLFEALTSSTGARLQFSVYDKYLSGLEKVIKKMKTLSQSNLLQSERSLREEKILEVDGTVTTQPVLEHVGISTWPGRLVLTDHALYFEALRVVSFDKAKRYDLSDDLKQVIKPELTGPWGTRLFDKAVLYKSISLSEPVVIEFPELKGHTRRDFWLAIIREVLYVHRFINKFQIKGIQRSEALSKAVLGILRLQAIQDICSTPSLGCESLLMFNLCDQLPGGDLILETLANMSEMKENERTNNSTHEKGMYSISALDVASHLGFGMGTALSNSNENELVVGEIAVGKMTPLERAVKESRNNYEKVVMARETVDGAKVDGIDTNLAVMKELMLPVSELGMYLVSLALWEDPMKSLAFCLVSSYTICRDWLPYAMALLLAFMAVFMMVTRLFNQGGTPVDEVKVVAPPAMNAMEQLLAVQNTISQVEQLIQDGNIVLLKLRALLLAIFPQATLKFAVCLLVIALTLAFLPTKYILLMVFLEAFTRYSPPRKASTERWTRRVKEWWFSIPAAPVILDREKEDKKGK
ncbi:uncharacterized protein LOC111484949 [Cucurbita maxima]|uniref:Uncharacterized protein LOC111484949 n=1 Tax=Cucurbita maxima TaxID=3661 RepID=A0A6J1JA73_CUCMA|nr:uncharacterized protein LOC111484949 [Cucurbita maxima]XP_022987376.1 uncharacterized protein LOC111484949 [Cucurbita maxima]XP_022987377.1 uncharacterized protein LOC111484949 [Cucurbita maxima]